ncbi:hypothetical protein ACQUQP_16460 [Marinobacterium sp. YM272]|uniref:hypothetical protein n=1 Tax=Marinobacterium sp. YM272 TaxID=3421654 RepID=UPI003D7FF5C5
MGYKISSLKSLPVIPSIDLYVFILGQHKWAGGYSEVIEDNFSRLAQHLGERGAIVAGHDGISLTRELSRELSNAALSNRTIHDFVAKGESLGLSVLLVGTHPSHLTDDDLFLLAPIEQIESRFGSLDLFFSELCEFSENRDTSFLEKFEEREKTGCDVSDFFELKPNMFGIGININAIINRWRQR